MRALAATLILISGLVLPNTRAEAQDLSQSVRLLEQRVERLAAHLERLEAQLAEHGQRVRRLKEQPAGVRRDYQLQSALRSSQQLADRSTSLQDELRSAQEALLSAYDRARRASTDPSRRAHYARRHAALTQRTGRAATRIVVTTHARPTDSAEDLEEKADLLDDSAEKVARELTYLRRQLAALSARSKLRRHRRTADDTLFVEENPRRLGRVARTTLSSTASGESPPTHNDSSSPAVDRSSQPAPSQMPAADQPTTDIGWNKVESSPSDSISLPTFGDVAPSAGGSDASRSPMPPAAEAPAPMPPAAEAPAPIPSPPPNTTVTAPEISLRSTLDPATFDALRRAIARGNATPKLSRLRASEARLDRLKRHLSEQARALRAQAKQLRQPQDAPAAEGAD